MATALDAFYPFLSQTLSNANWQNYLLMFAVDGVRQTLNGTSSLAVVQNHLGADMSVDVSTGRLLLQGIFGENSTVKNLTIAANSSGNPRIDVVVIRITQATPTVQFDVLQGTPAGIPTAPALTQTAAIYEVALANIAVANGAASIVTANITDERGWGGALAIRTPNIASATALPYTGYTNAAPIVIIPVTGTTNITSIPAGPANTILILNFSSSACTVTNGVNLRLARDYISQATSGTLMLQSDGTNWTEIARGTERAPAHSFYGNVGAGVAQASFSSLTACDLPSYTTWTLTSLTQNGALTTSNPIARISQFGKFAHIYGSWTIGTVGTANTALIMTIPVGLTLSANHVAGGAVGVFQYVGAATFFVGCVRAQSSTTLGFMVNAATGLFGTTAGGGPTTANGDSIYIDISVELA